MKMIVSWKTNGRRELRAPAVVSLLAVCLLSFGCVTTTVDNGPASDSDQAIALRGVGLDYLSLGRTGMAIRKLQESLLLDPNDSETLLWLGEGYRRKLRLDEARSYMERALELDPESHTTLLNLTGLYIQMEMYDVAIKLANELIDDVTFGNPWEALNNRGWAQFKSGQIDAADASFREALEYLPLYWPSRLNLGIVATERGERRQAIDHFTQVVERYPDGFAAAEANYRIGEVYVSWGHRDKAIGYFESAFSDAPNSQWGEQSKDYLDLLN